MRNTVPARSLEVTLAAKACRHLLRHLDEPLQTCTNPLIAAHFARAPTLQDVRGLLAAMSESLPNRDREILQRCDLRAQPHKLVARAMGLSMRHFYRERGAMIDRLAMQLFISVPARRTPEVQTPGEHIVTKTSRYSFSKSVARLHAAILEAGATVFANIDQAAAAGSAGLTLRPTMLLLFGNPKSGTPLIKAAPLIALELPLKILIWDEGGRVRVAFTPMTEIAARYGLTGMDAQIAAMDKMLNAIAGAVA